MDILHQKRKLIIDDIIRYDGIEYNRIEIEEWSNDDVNKTIEWRLSEDESLVEYYSSVLGWGNGKWFEKNLKMPELELMFRGL